MTFFETLTRAVNDFVTKGFKSEDQLRDWLENLRKAAHDNLVSEAVMVDELKRSLRSVFIRLTQKGGLFKFHPGISQYTIARLMPAMRAELDRRIMASVNLIKLNRQSAIEKTLQRLAGWATSIPAGGTKSQDKLETKVKIRKALASLPFEERRVAIDQGHKMTAAINEVVAEGSGAIAAEWHSHWRQPNYNYREDHKDRDKKVYLIRHSWAHDKGLVKPGKAGYTDEVTKPGEAINCRCWYVYLYNLNDLPDDMLTKRGRDALDNPKVA